MPVSSIRSGRLATALILASLLIAIVFDAQKIAQRSEDFASEPRGADERRQTPADVMSAMQSVVHVDLLGLNDKAKAESDPAVDRQATLEDGALKHGAVSSKSEPKVKASDGSLVSVSNKGEAVSHTGSALLTLQAMIRFMDWIRFGLAERVGAKAFTGVAIVVLVLLAVCMCYVGVTIAFPSRFGHSSSRSGSSTPGGSIKDPPEVAQQRQQMLAHQQPFIGDASPSYYQRSPGAVPGPLPSSSLSPFAPLMLATPIMSSNAIPSASQPVLGQEIKADDVPKPPPLCPTLLMPVCEARFGIPMFELAQLSSEGDLSIVGLSGNALLRAVVRRIGNTRTLEIGMPEPGSAPRATIAPSTQEISGGQQGSRALEIRGMRGAFYGILEMRASGACYVIKDGQAVLTIDGDAESLQLSIKSSVGLPLASVRCSAEPFRGVDHVEIRVEPGVDTVLVLAVVLAVLLLSPYMPPPDQ